MFIEPLRRSGGYFQFPITARVGQAKLSAFAPWGRSCSNRRDQSGNLRRRDVSTSSLTWVYPFETLAAAVKRVSFGFESLIWNTFQFIFKPKRDKERYMKIGYRRVSSEDQSLDRQDLGECDKIFEEKLSGASAATRPALQELISFCREGDRY